MSCDRAHLSRVEPPEPIAGLAPIAELELAIEIDGVSVPLPEGYEAGDAARPIDVEAAAARRGGGGLGVPKRCRTCGQLKKGGCGCKVNK